MHVSQLVADEFWAQGDLERETFGERPQPMMDREASLAKVQLQFIDGVCREVYSSLDSISSGRLGELVRTMEENRTKWEEEQDEEKKKSNVTKKGRNL